ncbi:PTS transporter subunit EIIB [Actinomycetaceae bacterium TAE3-ERU4]|nr:PTS transporter subunit EIIB [Actinomycetaceae bacterium TAE3-ERU4]
MINLEKILAGLGGPKNIVEIEPCITRLRVEVVEASKIDFDLLTSSGCHGISSHGTGIQVVVGPNAELIAHDLSDLLSSNHLGDN